VFPHRAAEAHSLSDLQLPSLLAHSYSCSISGLISLRLLGTTRFLYCALARLLAKGLRDFTLRLILFFLFLCIIVPLCKLGSDARVPRYSTTMLALHRRTFEDPVTIRV